MRRRSLVVLICTGLLAGCASPNGTSAIAPATLLAAVPADIDGSPRRTSRQVLALSSGGADGAFGAGVLVGWSEEGSRPSFDIVSGVSVGALQAPLAFLGAQYDTMLEEVFTQTRTQDAFDGNGFGAVIKTGLSDAAPLRRLLGRLLTPAMLDEIAFEHARGRRLFVTTTDLSRGRSVTWDMGRLASSGLADAREAFIAILVASAAPPGFVEPVALIDPATEARSLHGDGGVKRPIVVESDMLDRGDVLWIIANGQVSRTSSTDLAAASPSIAALASRGVSQLLRSLIYGSVERAALVARNRGAVFRLQRIPNTIPEAKNPFVFDPVEMRVLFEAGRARGRDPRSWLDRAEEVARGSTRRG